MIQAAVFDGHVLLDQTPTATLPSMAQHRATGQTIGYHGPTLAKFKQPSGRRYTPAAARQNVQRAMTANVASLSRTFNPLAAAAAFSGGAKSRAEALSDMYGDHDTFNAQKQILTIEDEFTEYERLTGARAFPSSSYIASTMKTTYGRYKDQLTNKVMHMAVQDGITRKAESVFKPDGFNPNFEYCPLAILVEQVLHCVRREAKLFIVKEQASQDRYKAEAYPEALIAIRRIIAFCMMYPMPAHFRMISLLGSRLTMTNEPELNVVSIVEATAREIALEPQHSHMRKGFHVTADAFRMQFPAMRQNTAKNQTKTKRQIQQGKPKRQQQQAGSGRGQQRHANAQRGRGQYQAFRGPSQPNAQRGRGARGRGHGTRGRGQ